jgi:hypothetical protein
MGQLGFFEANKRLEALSARGDPLEAIDRLVPWEELSRRDRGGGTTARSWMGCWTRATPAMMWFADSMQGIRTLSSFCPNLKPERGA